MAPPEPGVGASPSGGGGGGGAADAPAGHRRAEGQDGAEAEAEGRGLEAEEEGEGGGGGGGGRGRGGQTPPAALVQGGDGGGPGGEGGVGGPGRATRQDIPLKQERRRAAPKLPQLRDRVHSQAEVGAAKVVRIKENLRDELHQATTLILLSDTAEHLACTRTAEHRAPEEAVAEEEEDTAILLTTTRAGATDTLRCCKGRGLRVWSGTTT